MVIDHCTLTEQDCMIHHFNQRVNADARMYLACLYVKCTMIYDHICTQFWRSVSPSGHGNMSLKKLPRPTRVRSRPPQWHSLVLVLQFLVNFACFDERHRTTLVNYLQGKGVFTTLTDKIPQQKNMSL